MPEMMTGVTLRAGREGIPVPKAICYSVTVLWQQGMLPNQVTVTCIAAVSRLQAPKPRRISQVKVSLNVKVCFIFILCSTGSQVYHNSSSKGQFWPFSQFCRYICSHTLCCKSYLLPAWIPLQDLPITVSGPFICILFIKIFPQFLLEMPVTHQNKILGLELNLKRVG